MEKLNSDQLNIEFGQDNSVADFERANKLLEDLNIKYPYAKLLFIYKGNGQYDLNGLVVKEEDLEDKFRTTNDVYKPDEKERWYDK